MSTAMQEGTARHGHVFLGEGHEQAERRTWAVITLCGCMMLAEIAGGLTFGSIALVADGLHMSTHAGALLLAALAYHLARRYADDPRFTFGTGKLGDLAGFSSAVVLAMIALLIGYEAVGRLFEPVPIRFGEAIPIACMGLAVNVASVWLLSGGYHHHHHGAHAHDDEEQRVHVPGGTLVLGIFEDGHPPVFRVHAEDGPLPTPGTATLETERPDGTRQAFALEAHGGFLQGDQEIPEPHAFTAHLSIGGQDYPLVFEEHGHSHGAAYRDNNLRAAVVHVLADAAVSALVIVGLVLARLFGWLWMDPLAGITGACVIASWSYGLVRDTGGVLLDMNPDRAMRDRIERTVQGDGDRVTDLHLWRLGPGHLGAILAVTTGRARGPDYYRGKLSSFRSLSHVTVEVHQA